ncbi:hypothetical protein [Nonomuraea sp. LPB2021202275-12-8]|uniref:hypothetical protein n=1 Tax=Nonomuraea sp. LPB2021202275-12-8 TaxID=3120159 RepID=UPI00300DB9D7
MTVLLALIGLALALRQGHDARARLLCAAAVLATPWLGMSGALVFPDTATHDPEFAGRTVFVLGLHGQAFMALVLILVLIGTARRPCACPRRPGDRNRCSYLHPVVHLAAFTRSHPVPTVEESKPRRRFRGL